MSTALLRPYADVSIQGQTVPAREGSCTLDFGAIPYGRARVVIPLLDPDTIEDLDPRRIIRGGIVAGDEARGTARQFDLGLRSRRIDYKTKTIEIELATDEAVLIDYASLTDDTTPRTYEKSIRALINYVLGKVIPPRLNHARNPSFRLSTAGWIASLAGTSGTLTRVTGSAPPELPAGVARGRLTLTAASAGRWGFTGGIPVGILTPGLYYTLSGFLHTNGTVNDGRVIIRWLNAGGGVVSESVSNPLLITDFSPSWRRYSVSGKMPATAVRAQLQFMRDSGASGDVLDVTGVMFEEGSQMLAPFDGESFPDAGTSYVGGAEDSSSRWPKSLEPGTTDADITAAWVVQNLLGNPSFETNITGWSAANSSALVRSTAVAGFMGAAHLQMTSTAAGTAYVRRDETVRVTPGRLYSLSGYVRNNVAGRDGRVFIRWLNQQGATIRDVTGSTAISTGEWRRVTVSAVAPANAASAQVFIGATSVASGETIRVDAVMFTEGPVVPYHDGSTPADAYYVYSWDDGTDTTSTRTPIKEREPSSFTWGVGVTAWDFLDPFMASVGLRLFCDELRTWRLIKPETYTAPGLITLSDAEAVEGDDEINLGDPNAYCTGVAVRYTWTDSNGDRRSRTDAAGLPGNVLLVDIERPWPGAGVAQAMLNRRKGQGRVQEVAALHRWSTTPTMQCVITLPGTYEQLGSVLAVTWGLTDGLMNVRTRELTDIIPGSINALIGSIDSLTGTIDSL